MKTISKILAAFFIVYGVFIISPANAVTESNDDYQDNGVVVGTKVGGALIEEKLEYPEAGWKRYDNTNELIEYLGLHKILRDEDYYSSTLSLSWGNKSKIHFVVEGSKFRLLLGNVPEDFKVVNYPFELFKTKIYVDGNLVDTKCSISSRLNYARGSMLKYEYEFENSGKHDVVLEMDSDIDEVHLDAIDVMGRLIDKNEMTESDKNHMYKLYRYYNDTADSYLYSFINSSSLGNGYIKDSEVSYNAYQEMASGTVPIYEYYRAKDNKYFYTMNNNLIAKEDSNYKFLGLKFFMDKTTASNIVVFEKPLLGKLLSLYRYCKYSNDDHLYTTNFNELGEGNLGYTYESVQCHVFECKEDNTVELYRYCRYGDNMHFYTTDIGELGTENSEYSFEGVCGYVYDSQINGSVELYRYYQNSTGGHFYTTNFNELGNGNGDYILEKVECYVMP